MTTGLTAPRHGVAAEIRGLMAKKRVTQEQLAAHMGVSQAAIARRLSGRVPFDVDELSKIAEYFAVPVASLYPAESSGAVQ